MILAFQATVRRELLVLPAELLFDSKDTVSSVSQGIHTFTIDATHMLNRKKRMIWFHFHLHTHIYIYSYIYIDDLDVLITPHFFLNTPNGKSFKTS